MGLPPARRHARPAPDRPPLLRLHRRRHGPLHHRRRAAPGDAVGSRARHRRHGSASGWVNQRIIYTHGIGIAMVPVNEVTHEGQPRLLVKDLPPVSSGGAPSVSEPRIYFGESDVHYVDRGREADRSSTTRGRHPAGARPTSRHAGPARPGITLDTTLIAAALRPSVPRPGPAHQRPGHAPTASCCSTARCNDRLQLIAPFLSYDKDPYLVIDDDGRLVYVQDAFTTSDRFPNAQPFNPAELGATGLPPVSPSTTSGTASRSRWTRTTGR